MSNAVDLTDKFNNLLEEYTVAEGNATVDLDAWHTGDLLDVLTIVEQILQLRGEELPERSEIDPDDLGEYDAMPPAYYDED